jgi:hypothetical protein
MATVHEHRAAGASPVPTPGLGSGRADDDADTALDAWLAWSVSAGLDRPLPRPDPEPDDDGSRTAAAPRRRGRPGPITGPVPLPRLGDPRHPDTPTESGGPANDVPPEVRRGAGVTPVSGDANTGGDGDEADDGTWHWAPRRLREPGDDAPADHGRNRRVLVGVAASGVLGLGLVAGGLAFTRGDPPGATSPATTAACADATAPSADVDGDGCPEELAVDGNRVSAGGATWELGRPGDVVAVGDWDCDGSATSALLRPATGDVFVFAGWSGAGEPVTVTPTRSVPGGVGLRVDSTSGRCDSLVVEAAGGAGIVVDEAQA